MAYIIGRKPVLEALRAGSAIKRIYLLNRANAAVVKEIFSLAEEKQVPIVEVDHKRFAELTGAPVTQGVAALREEFVFTPLEKLITLSKQRNSFLLILDGIQDTHNLGALLRTAECAGVDGIILPKHNSAPLNETVAKTSAGAIEHLDICEVTNLSQAIKILKDEGFWIFGTAVDRAKDFRTQDYAMPIAVIMGGEEKGMRRLITESCDFLVSIQMHGKIESLNVSVAAGILLFKIAGDKFPNKM